MLCNIKKFDKAKRAKKMSLIKKMRLHNNYQISPIWYKIHNLFTNHKKDSFTKSGKEIKVFYWLFALKKKVMIYNNILVILKNISK